MCLIFEWIAVIQNNDMMQVCYTVQRRHVNTFNTFWTTILNNFTIIKIMVIIYETTLNTYWVGRCNRWMYNVPKVLLKYDTKSGRLLFSCRGQLQIFHYNVMPQKYFPYHWPCVREFTGDQCITLGRGQYVGVLMVAFLLSEETVE